MTRARAACIVVDRANANVLLMHRSRAGQQYYVVPGGGIEPGETAQQACLRELAEETSLRATRTRLILSDDHDGARTDYFLIRIPTDNLDSAVRKRSGTARQPVRAALG